MPAYFSQNQSLSSMQQHPYPSPPNPPPPKKNRNNKKPSQQKKTKNWNYFNDYAFRYDFLIFLLLYHVVYLLVLIMFTLPFQMVRTEPGTVKRLPRHLRNEDIPSHTFTPRTYQVLIQLKRIFLIVGGGSHVWPPDQFDRWWCWGFSCLKYLGSVIEPLQIRKSTEKNVIRRHLKTSLL